MYYLIDDITPMSEGADGFRVARVSNKEEGRNYLLNLNPLFQGKNKATGAFLREDRTVITDAGLIVLIESNNKALRDWERGDTLQEEL